MTDIENDTTHAAPHHTDNHPAVIINDIAGQGPASEYCSFLQGLLTGYCSPWAPVLWFTSP
jgi:hypothetical protein